MKQEQEKQIMKDIEKKTEKIVQKAIQTGKIVNPIIPGNEKKMENNVELLENIMRSGAKEFVLKTGRELNYYEMREMYG